MQFPEVIELSRDIEPPWGRRCNQKAWLTENMHRFLFPLNDIRGGAVEYRPPGDGPNGPGIYFLQWDGDVVYVGKSNQIAQRLWAHFKSQSKQWTHFWCITGVPDEILEEVEYMYVAWLNPIHNVLRRGYTEIAHELIANLERYRPFDSVEIRPGVRMIAR